MSPLQQARLQYRSPYQMKVSPGKPKRVGVVLSGGQAPGGHNVIIALLEALLEINPRSELFGFCDGPKGIIENKSIPLTLEKVAPYRNQGGFDMLGSGRTKIETKEQFEAAAATVKALNLDGLVVIGGDDSNTNAAFLSEYLTCSVIGVPKTIDGDLKNEFIEVSFGFDTACKIYSEIIGNIARDALSAKKTHYFIKMMGRSASHITLACAMQTHPNLALISEEKKSLEEIVKEIADMIVARSKIGKEYSVILIPEGIIEFIPDIEGRTLDSHGNVEVSKIETERFFIAKVEEELKKRPDYKSKFSAQPHFCGYEGRSGLPSNFDCNYCDALGRVAAILIDSGATGEMACLQGLQKPVSEWHPTGIPLKSMMGIEERNGKKKNVIKKALVDLSGARFKEFQRLRPSWLLNDDYLCPGPIQFFGPKELTDTVIIP